MSFATASIKTSDTNEDESDLMSSDDDFEDDDGDGDDNGEAISSTEGKEVWTIFNPFTKPFWEN